MYFLLCKERNNFRIHFILSDLVFRTFTIYFVEVPVEDVVEDCSDSVTLQFHDYLLFPLVSSFLVSIPYQGVLTFYGPVSCVSHNSR